MSGATSDVWVAMSTARTIRRFTDEPVGGEQLLREAVGVPEDWMIAGHIVVGRPNGRHGPVRRRPLAEVVNADHWDAPADLQEKR